MPPRLRVKGLSKSFGGVEAVRSASLEVGPGQILGLVGANGAGKSTLIRMLGGVIRPDAGTIELDGEVVEARTPHRALELGIAVIHQELHLVGAQSLAENLFLGRARPMRLGVIDWRAVNRRARRAFEELGIEVDATKPAEEASVWERWATMIVRALMDKRRLLVLDEPTAAMDPDGVERVFRAVRGASAEGCAVIFVSHRLDEVLGLCSRVHAMREGESVADAATAEIDRGRLIAMIAGDKEVTAERQPPAVAAGGHVSGGVALAVEEVGIPGRLRGVSFRAEPGEVVGLAGLVGSGRTSLLRTIAGCERAGGRIWVGEEELRLGSPGSARKLGIGLVPEERIAEGLIHSFTVAENIAFGRRPRRVDGGPILRYGTEAAEARVWIDKLSIAGAAPRVDVLSLSGGNQQKTLFARSLARRPRVLLLDEPTRGVDIGAKADLLALVREFADEGGVCVVSLSDLEELSLIADRVVVLREGSVAARLEGEGADQKAILEACYDRG